MEIAIVVIVFGVAALFVLFILAKRMLKLAVRLMLGAMLVLILVAGSLFWWWSRGTDSSAGNSNRPASPQRRSTSR